MALKEELSTVTIKELLDAGSHFGHQTSRWNPKMKRFIFEERGGLHIIDLAKTMQLLRSACEVVKETVAARKSILFVGTKKQAKSVIKECAEACNEHYVADRWLGGMLTNLQTIRQSVKKLEKAEKRLAIGGEGLTKKETSLLSKEQEKLERNLGGVRFMKRLPGLVIIVDPSREHIAVAEANKLGIPVMALIDTNCNPDPITYNIPCNDDALKSVKLVLQVLTDGIIEQKNAMNLAFDKQDEEGELEATVFEKIAAEKAAGEVA